MSPRIRRIIEHFVASTGTGGVKGSLQAGAPRVSGQLGVCALQLAEQNLASGVMRQTHVLVVNSKFVQECAHFGVRHPIYSSEDAQHRQHLSVGKCVLAPAGEMDHFVCPIRPLFCIQSSLFVHSLMSGPARRRWCLLLFGFE